MRFLYANFLPVFGGDGTFAFRSVVHREVPVGEVMRPKRYFPAVAHSAKGSSVFGVIIPDAAERVPPGLVVGELDLVTLFGG